MTADNVISRENVPLNGISAQVEEGSVWDEEDRKEVNGINSDIRNDTDLCIVPSFFLGFYSIWYAALPVLKSERKHMWNDLMQAARETL